MKKFISVLVLAVLIGAGGSYFHNVHAKAMFGSLGLQQPTISDGISNIDEQEKAYSSFPNMIETTATTLQ